MLIDHRLLQPMIAEGWPNSSLPRGHKDREEFNFSFLFELLEVGEALAIRCWKSNSLGEPGQRSPRALQRRNYRAWALRRATERCGLEQGGLDFAKPLGGWWQAAQSVGPGANRHQFKGKQSGAYYSRPLMVCR